CVRPYAPESPWNTPIGVSEPIDPDSAFYVATLGDALTSDPTQFTYPVYEISGDTPVRTVRLDGWFSNVTGNGRLMQNDRAVAVELPIPDGAAPAAGDDSQIIIVDLESGEEWGAFRFRQTESGEYVAENAYHYNTAWDGVPPPSTGGGVFVNRGSGVPYLAGLVRPCEIAAGRIEHALAFAYASPSPDYVYPATKSDGAGELHNDLPEGARLQLDPGLTDEDLTGLGCTNACLTVAHALQEYGMFVVDNSGRPKVMVEFEGTASWQGAIDEGTVSPIPLERLRVLDTRTIPARAGCTITGTSGDDVLVGTRSADVICGLEGDDEIEGLEGNDVIYGGAGRDVIDGGGGQDRVEAGAGDDRVAGDAGWDVLDGGEGEDWIDGGRGSDRIFAADGEADVVDGGPGSNEAQLDAADTATAVTAS
ncbi:MAG: calcium-binding protein, partial [Gaiellales bacterium]